MKIFIFIILFAIASSSYADTTPVDNYNPPADGTNPTINMYSTRIPDLTATVIPETALLTVYNLFVDAWDFFLTGDSSHIGVRDAGLFGLPRKLLIDMHPSASASSIVVRGGNTFGDHTVDFADWPNNVFLTIKAIVMFICSWLSLKIAVRGN